MAIRDLIPGITGGSGDEGGLLVVEQGHVYCIRQISWNDTARQAEYQQLRAQIFVEHFRWQLPVVDGKEVDHYDLEGDHTVSIHCVYGRGSEGTEHLLGGVRIFQLVSWEHSMIMCEFHDAGMIPTSILQRLMREYACNEFLEITRLCLQRGRYHGPSGAEHHDLFDLMVARDLTYAAVYAVASQSRRQRALGIADARYLRVMRRSGFVFQEIYAQLGSREGFALIVIDLIATIWSLSTRGEHARTKRMLALCQQNWINQLE